jgi:WD40 repeat protein
MHGAVELVRATAEGLELLPLEAGRRFSRTPTSPDRLHVEGDHILGVGADEVRVWRSDGELRTRIQLLRPTVATVHAREQLVAVGTEDGGVALVDLAQGAADVAPNTVHLSRDRIADLAFSHAGRWLASGAGGLTIWAWDVAR